jgi:hypothetical protein
MPADLHRDGLGRAPADHVANAGATQVMKQLVGHLGFLAYRAYRLALDVIEARGDTGSRQALR